MRTRPSHYEARTSTKTVLDIARLLARSQEDVSEIDISRFVQEYRGPPEGMELILSEYPVQYDMRSTDDGNCSIYPTLAAILRAYAENPSPWEPVLRALVRRGADLHAPVRRDRGDMDQIGYPCHMAEYGTPLDELFRWNRDSVASRTAADGWLRILADEGHDPSAYLKKEFIWLAEDMHFTHASISSVGYDSPRKLFFRLGDCPSVFWKWWIDPTSSTSLLREEFECLITTSPEWLKVSRGWKEQWPFTYPEWFKLHQGYKKGEQLSHCKEMLKAADKRANRRINARAARSAQAQRSGRSRRVPGAWPL